MAEGHVAFLRTCCDCDYAILAGMMTETTELNTKRQQHLEDCTCGAWTQGCIRSRPGASKGTNAKRVF